VVLVCDRCQTTLSHPDTDSEIHYDAPAQARADAVEDLHWSSTGGRDWCPGCTCAAQGHDWPAWLTPPPTSQLAPYRWCERCSAVEVHDQGVIGRD
jgi:hypothetical protein